MLKWSLPREDLGLRVHAGAVAAGGGEYLGAAAGKGAARQGAAGSDAAGSDAAGSDGAGSDEVGRDGAGRDGAGGSAASEGAARQGAAGSDEPGGSAAGESAARVDAAREGAAGEAAADEAAAGEAAAEGSADRKVAARLCVPGKAAAGGAAPGWSSGTHGALAGPGAGAGVQDAFRPPPHERARGRAGRLRVRLRRIADLQFGSIWRDLERLLPGVQGVLVDLGAGAQPFRDLLPSGVRYVAVDTEEAERRFGYRTADTRYFRGHSLPLSDAEADFILCTETLEHVRDTTAFLREARRALAPGGILILTVPFAARWHFVPHDFWRFTPTGLDHVLKDAGFRDVRVYARGGALAVACYKVLGLTFLMLVGGGRRGAPAVVCRAAGACLAPMAALAVLLGHLGIRFPGPADDTLGYTVLAG